MDVIDNLLIDFMKRHRQSSDTLYFSMMPEIIVSVAPYLSNKRAMTLIQCFLDSVEDLKESGVFVDTIEIMMNTDDFQKTVKEYFSPLAHPDGAKFS